MDQPDSLLSRMGQPDGSARRELAGIETLRARGLGSFVLAALGCDDGRSRSSLPCSLVKLSTRQSIMHTEGDARVRGGAREWSPREVGFYASAVAPSQLGGGPGPIRAALLHRARGFVDGSVL